MSFITSIWNEMNIFKIQIDEIRFIESRKNTFCHWFWSKYSNAVSCQLVQDITEIVNMMNSAGRHLQWRNRKFSLEQLSVYGTTAIVVHLLSDIVFVNLDNFSVVSFEKVVKLFTILTNCCKYHNILLSELNKCPYIF